MRSRRIKKNFWFSDEEDNALKHLSEQAGKTQTQVIRKLVTGAEIKEKPTEDFYKTMKELLELRKEIKNLRAEARHFRAYDTNKISRILNEIDKFRTLIIEKYLQ
ncbi:MAG: hypothetical protein IKF97_04855 [Clostridia bacterium]|nr:hypothetical protein [Clostridia bacterium]